MRSPIMNCRLLLLLVLCAGMTSCRRAAEKARENIRIEEVERVEPRGFTGLDLVLRVRNDTGYKIRLEHVSLDLFVGSSRVVEAVLRESVEVPRHTVGSFAVRWRIRIADPLALYALARRLRKNDLSDIVVSYAVEGRGGPASINISRERVPLSEFLSTFGISSEELQNYFGQ